MQTVDFQNQFAGPCWRHLVKRLQLFGSVSRGQGTPESDLDLLVQFHEMSAADYSSHYFALLHEIEDKLDRRIDLLTPAGLKRRSLEESIRRDAVLLYEG